MTVTVMASRHSVTINCDLLFGNQERPFTVPMFTNSSSGSPQALTDYRDFTTLPLATMLQEAGHDAVDPSFVWICDSSLGNCDDSR